METNIKMVAIAPYDGWAFIQKDGRLHLLRPPYHANDLIEVSEKDLERAVNRYGFEACDFEFINFAGAIAFLKQTYVENMKKQGFSLPQKDEIKALLNHATDEILYGYLEKVEKEFIPQRRLDAAETLLMDLLRLDKVCKNDSLRNRVLDLIEACRKGRGKRYQANF